MECRRPHASSLQLRNCISRRGNRFRDLINYFLFSDPNDEIPRLPYFLSDFSCHVTWVGPRSKMTVPYTLSMLWITYLLLDHQPLLLWLRRLTMWL
jgi:hypothetical protein